MFGIGTLSILLLYTFMGPTITLCILVVIAAYTASILLSIYKSDLSDSTLAQDLANINRSFDTDAILAAEPTQQDMASYYTRSNQFQYQVLNTLLAPGIYTRLYADYPLSLSMANSWQAMRVLSTVAGVHAKEPTKVLEITATKDGHHCSLMLANVLPQDEFEFNAIDMTSANDHASSAVLTKVHLIHDTSTIVASTFDVIFAIESIAHVDALNRMRTFMTKAATFLAPAGSVVIIDCFRSENFTQAPPDQQLAMRLAERAFKIQQLHSMSEWIECAHRAGLRLKRLDDLTPQALPCWTLGWRIAHSVLTHAPAWVIRRLRASQYTCTDNLLAFATFAHAMRNRGAAVYGVMEFVKVVQE